MFATKLASKTRVAVALAAVLLAGCGKSSPAAVRLGSQVTKTLEAAAPLPAVAAGQDNGAGVQILAHVRSSLASATGFSAELMSTTEGHYKQGEYGAELRHVSEGFRIIWAKPKKFHAVVFNAPTALMEGATLVTTDGVNCSAKAAGLLGFMTIHAKANDPRIANARNHTFDKFAPSAQMDRLTAPTAVWTLLDQVNSTLPGGKPTVRVRVDNVVRLDKEIDSEILTIDLNTASLKSMIALVKGHPVTTYTFSKFAWNPKVSSDTFTL